MNRGYRDERSEGVAEWVWMLRVQVEWRGGESKGLTMDRQKYGRCKLSVASTV